MRKIILILLFVPAISLGNIFGFFQLLLSGNDDEFPIGAVAEFVGSTCPTNYLKLDQVYSLNKNEYSKLFTQVQYTYGGSGNTFVLPNMAGLYTRGVGSQSFEGVTYSAPIASVREDAIQNITGQTWGKNSWGGLMRRDLVSGVFQIVDYGGGHNAKGGGGDNGVYMDFDASRVIRTDTTTHGADYAMISCVRVR